MARVIIEREAMLVEINQEMASLPACRNLRLMDVIHDPARVQGCNWTMGSLVRSGYDYAEFECQRAMADFTADLQERFDI
jgi:hypothetical protein